MIIDPQKIAKQRIIEGGSVAQNGIDCHILRLVEIIDGGIQGKVITPPQLVAVQAIDGLYRLEPGKGYQFECLEVVNIPAGMCAMLVGRSSLNRRGINIFSGLYDSGYNGRIGGTLRTLAPVKLGINTAILQIVFMGSEGTAMYDGTFQHNGLRERGLEKMAAEAILEGGMLAGAEVFNNNEKAKAVTGAGVKYDGGKPRFDLIEPRFIEDIAKVLTLGSIKYGDNNWKNGLDEKRIFAALQRHAWAMQRGELIDVESGCLHSAHIACNAMMWDWMVQHRNKESK
jgi:deoxycytidine triphosphate deaminase